MSRRGQVSVSARTYELLRQASARLGRPIQRIVDDAIAEVLGSTHAVAFTAVGLFPTIAVSARTHERIAAVAARRRTTIRCASDALIAAVLDREEGPTQEVMDRISADAEEAWLWSQSGPGRCAWRACPSDAHRREDQVDHCGTCAPFWGRYPICHACGDRLEEGRAGHWRCAACQIPIAITEP